MSFLDKIASAIMPAETAQERREARDRAQSSAMAGGWLAIVLDQHRQIEEGFARSLTAADGPKRLAAFRELERLLAGHASAEELVLYPALVQSNEKAHAAMAYEEHAMTKINLARLETLDPMSEEWRETLETTRDAVLHHVYKEEATWFPDLQGALPESAHERLTARFLEEYARYAGPEASQLRPGGVIG